MLLLSMTATEMRQSIEADYPAIAHKTADILKQWRKRVLRTNRTRRMAWVQSITCAKSKQEYMFVFVWDPDVRRLDYFILFAVVHDYTHTYYIADTVHDEIGDTLTAYTDHFFHRFAERTGMGTGIPIEQAIVAYYRGYTQPVLLYWDQDADVHRAVYAEQQGIKLADVDTNKWILYRTFISLDMLKPTQREAYRNVMELIERGTDLRNKCDRTYGRWRDYMKKEDEESSIDIINKARDIYAQYFEN